MQEELGQEFNHEALESSIERLAKEIRAAAGGVSERSAEARTGQEAVKHALRSLTPLAQQSTASQSAVADDPLRKYTEGAPPEIQLEVEYLVDLALHKGVTHALNEAAKASPYVLDAVHDALTGKLYPELKRRGIVD